ncbi:MAG: hypothetical protein Q9211_002744 [Gyalolechia sp. 1 TL-2023]
MAGRIRPLCKAIFGVLGLTTVLPQVGVDIDPVIVSSIEEAVVGLTTLPAGPILNTSLMQAAGTTFIHPFLLKTTGFLEKFDFTLLLFLLLGLYYLFDLSRNYFFGSNDTNTSSPEVMLHHRSNSVGRPAPSRKTRKQKPKGTRQPHSPHMWIIRWWKKKYIAAVRKTRALKRDIDITTAKLHETEKNLVVEVAALRIEVATVKTQKQSVEDQLEASDGKLHKAYDELREHRKRNNEMQTELNTQESLRIQADSILLDKQRYARDAYEHEQTIADLRKKANQQKLANNDLEVRMAEISKDKSTHERKARDLQQTLNGVYDKLAHQSSELEVFRTGKDEAMAPNNQQHAAEKKALESRNEALANQIRILEEARRNDAEHIKSIKTLEKQNSDEIARLQKELASRDEKIVDLENEQDLVDAMHSDTLEEKENQLNEAAEKLADLTRKHELAEQEKARLNEQVQGLETRLTAVQHSAEQVGGEDRDTVSANAGSACHEPTKILPADPIPTQTAPVDTAPADASTAEIVPAYPKPTVIVQADSIPTETAPPDTTPADASTARIVPAGHEHTEIVQADSTPTKTAPANTTPVDASEVETMPAQIDTSFNPGTNANPEDKAHDDPTAVANSSALSHTADDTTPIAVSTGSVHVDVPNVDVDVDDHGNPVSDSNILLSAMQKLDITGNTTSDTQPIDFTSFGNEFNQGHWSTDWTYFANELDRLDLQNFQDALGDYDPMELGVGHNEWNPEQLLDDMLLFDSNYDQPSGGDEQMELGGDQNEAYAGQSLDDMLDINYGYTGMDYHPTDAPSNAEPFGDNDPMMECGGNEETDDPMDQETIAEPASCEQDTVPGALADIVDDNSPTAEDAKPVDSRDDMSVPETPGLAPDVVAEHGPDGLQAVVTSENPPQPDGSEHSTWDSSIPSLETTGMFTFGQAPPKNHGRPINWVRRSSPITNWETDPNLDDEKPGTTKAVRKFSDDEESTAKKQAKTAESVSDPPPVKLDTTGLSEDEKYSQLVESQVAFHSDPKNFMPLVEAHIKAHDEAVEATKKAEEEKRLAARIVSPFSDDKPKPQPLPIPPKHPFPFTRIVDNSASLPYWPPIKAAPYIPPHGRVSLGTQHTPARTLPVLGPRPGVGVDELPIGPPMPAFMRGSTVTDPGFSPTNPMYTPKLSTAIPLIGPPKDDQSGSEGDDDDQNHQQASAPVVEDSQSQAPAEADGPPKDERSRKTKQNQRSRRRQKQKREQKMAAGDEKPATDGGDGPGPDNER